MRKGSLKGPEKRPASKSFWQNPQHFSPWEEYSRHQNSQSDDPLDLQRVKGFLSTTIKSVFRNKGKERKFSLSGSYSAGTGILNTHNQLGKSRCSKLESISINSKSRLEKSPYSKQTIETVKCKTIQPRFEGIEVPKFKYNVRDLTRRKEQRDLKDLKRTKTLDKEGQKPTQKEFQTEKVNRYQYLKQENQSAREGAGRPQRYSCRQDSQSQKQILSKRASQNGEIDYESKGLKTKNRISWFIWTHKLSRSTKLRNLATLDAMIL